MSMEDYVIGGTKEDKTIMSRKEALPTGTAKQFLVNTKVKNLFPENRTKIIHVDKTDPVAAAFKILIDNHILSVPVYDSRHSQFIAFIDMLDIVVHCLREFKETELQSGENFEKLLESHHSLTKFNCGQVAGASGRTPYYPIDENSAVLTCIQLMVEKNCHRLPVIDAGGSLVSLVSQSLLVTMIEQNIGKFANATKTVSELNLGIQEVMKINSDQKALDAFKLIYDTKRLGVAVVDANGVLIGNISASDLKQIGSETHAIARLLIPAGKFIELVPRREDQLPGPYCVLASATLEEVILKVGVTKSHRVYVVDENSKPIGVISLVDILKAILQNV